METPGIRATSATKHGKQYWPFKLVLLAVWALASFGSCFFSRDLQLLVAGWPLGYWMAAQGALLVFLAIVAIHAWVMNRLDRAAAVAEDGAAQDG